MEPFFQLYNTNRQHHHPFPQLMKLHGFTPVLVSDVKIGYDTDLQVTNLDVFFPHSFRVCLHVAVQKKTHMTKTVSSNQISSWDISHLGIHIANAISPPDPHPAPQRHRPCRTHHAAWCDGGVSSRPSWSKGPCCLTWEANNKLCTDTNTLPETLKIGRNPKRKGSSSNHWFSGAKLLVSGRV